MRIGIPREVKNSERRVALTPEGADELVRRGHEVYVEAGAGEGSSFADADYAAAGARVLGCADEVWHAAALVLKVKEPQPEEFHRLRAGQVLFTYLHLAAAPDCAAALGAAGTTAIAYEMVRLPDGSLPLLAPMSEIAGRLAPQAGATALLSAYGGRGVLLGGAPGVTPGQVVVLGAGVAGTNAAAVAVGLGADVTVLDIDLARLRRLEERFAGRVRTLAATRAAVAGAALAADLVIGAVLVAGERAPRVLDDDVVRAMRPGAVLVDVAIDQGGCFAGSRPTTHAEPTYVHHGCVYYCVANMPGAVPRTATLALTHATLPYVCRLADLGAAAALAADPALAAALCTSTPN